MSCDCNCDCVCVCCGSSMLRSDFHLWHCGVLISVVATRRRHVECKSHSCHLPAPDQTLCPYAVICHLCDGQKVSMKLFLVLLVAFFFGLALAGGDQEPSNGESSPEVGRGDTAKSGDGQDDASSAKSDARDGVVTIIVIAVALALTILVLALVLWCLLGSTKSCKSCCRTLCFFCVCRCTPSSSPIYQLSSSKPAKSRRSEKNNGYNNKSSTPWPSPRPADPETPTPHIDVMIHAPPPITPASI